MKAMVFMGRFQFATAGVWAQRGSRLLIVGYIAFLSLASAALGQSFFDLRNLDRGSEGLVNAPVFDAEGVPLSGTNYLSELWGSVSPNLLQPLLSYGSRQRLFAPTVIVIASEQVIGIKSESVIAFIGIRMLPTLLVAGSKIPPHARALG